VKPTEVEALSPPSPRPDARSGARYAGKQTVFGHLVGATVRAQSHAVPRTGAATRAAEIYLAALGCVLRLRPAPVVTVSPEIP